MPRLPTVWLVLGVALASGVAFCYHEGLRNWLAQPLSGSSEHVIDLALAWHARLMVLSWGLMIPIGILLARFFKVTPRQDWPKVLDNQLWWHGHRLLQYAAVTITFLATALALGVASTSSSPAASSHRVFGWSVVVIGVAQVIGARLRGSKGGPIVKVRETNYRHCAGDHYYMSRRRRTFEWTHKALGYSGVLLAAAATILGFAVADAPRWMGLVMAGWWTLAVIVFIDLQRQGRCIDTYQAIWGPGIEHPGARVSPIGWGIRQHPPDAIQINGSVVRGKELDSDLQ